MTRVSYDNLPAEGAKSDRDVSRTVNQAMLGFQNCVLDVVIPAGGLDSGTYTVLDQRVSAQKFINFMATSSAALLAGGAIFLSSRRNGEFDISVFPVELQGAAVQVQQTAGAMGSLLGPTLIPFDTVNLSVNFDVDLGGNSITVLTEGLVSISFSLSGTYLAGTTYEFGVNVAAGPHAGNTFTVFTSTGGGGQGNETFSVSASIIAELSPTDVLVFFGDATTISVFDPYNLVWNIERLGGADPIPQGAGPFEFAALIIG